MMNPWTQIGLSLLIVVAIGLNLYAALGGGRGYFVVAQLLLMPGIVLLTFLALVRAEKRRLSRRFPGDKKENREERDG